MTLGAKRPRLNLRQGLDRDVYMVMKKLEDANDGKPFKTTTAVYEAIKRSNSSLSRQKKRPLEDSIDRVLQFRKEELGDSSDSEADLEEPPKPDDDRFLLNRQMTKHWHQNTTTATTADTATPPTSEAPRAIKKRRVQEDGEERAKDGAITPKGALTDTDAAPAEKQDKTPLKKTQKSSRHKVEHPSNSIQIGGVAEIYTELCKQTHYVLKWPELFAVNRWRKVPGILLSGPPGIGKKSLIRFLASKIDVPIVSLTGCFEEPERLERSLNDAIEEAMKIAPCIILIEQLDWYMSKPEGSSHSEGHRRNVIQFMRQMRRIETEHDKDRHILAMATTSRITDVDPAVLKTGLFERTLQMRIPDLGARQDILKLVTRDKDLSETVDFAELAKITHGFVGADIINVVTLAQQLASERHMDVGQYPKHLELPFPISSDLPDLMELADEQPLSLLPEPPNTPLAQEDFKKAIKDFTPLLRKEGFTVIPNISWDQVGALQAARDQLNMSIIGPIKDPELYRRAGLSRPAGCLLWGPPGCGKTLVAQAVANEAQASFILINGPELLNKYVGESERAVRELFNRARSSTPCILFFDEMDSLVPKRDNASTEAGTRVVNALLTELDGVQDRTGVYVIGTTNRPDMIDPAMLRPGRLNVRLFIDLPTPDERVDILRAIYRTNHPDATAEEFERLEPVARDSRCTDFSGADLGGLHVKAAESALRRCLQGTKTGTGEIDAVDWEYALSTSNRSVQNPETYRKLEAKLGKS
ncbi:P-loop containing nucleoside triphosphate hydrolase protein [Fusarium redolens]|uniref:Peroxisomal ATPase PEX1 n=1 Tax=Fusarium redolens TaxID=48865 RepID=A0A9P9GDM6_FUSRE|nr:P-loop containing nucleoside triphosphate hydrolase protein [Fusarium redolens]KAH7237618.1 P-loop containing nucleoside triphosphate hydrolase protein [Fusarium redolens]